MAPPTIRSRSNPLVRRLRALRDRHTDESRNSAFVEGPTLVEEAWRSGLLLELVVTPRAAEGAWGRDALERIAASGLPVHRVDESVLRAISQLEHGPGVVGVARRPVFDAAALLRGVPLVLVAVGVQDPGNVGALLRTAEAAGASGALLTRGCADPLAWKSLRGSMGSAFRLPHRVVADTDEAMATLRDRGVRLLAAVARDGHSPDAVDLRGPVAFLLGAEGPGLPEAVVASADGRVAVPLAGGVESLNVAVAAGVLLFEAARQRRGVGTAPGGSPTDAPG